jgi:uncharacterized protein YneF (UPF0154 family)
LEAKIKTAKKPTKKTEKKKPSQSERLAEIKEKFIFQNFEDIVDLALDYSFYITERLNKSKSKSKSKKIRIPNNKQEKKIFMAGVVHGISSTVVLFDKYFINNEKLDKETIKDLIEKKLGKKNSKKIKKKVIASS